MSVIGLCCKKSEGNAGGVQSHVPVQLRQPLQTGWQYMPSASCCLLFLRHVTDHACRLVLPGGTPCAALQRVRLRPAWQGREWGHTALGGRARGRRHPRPDHRGWWISVRLWSFFGAVLALEAAVQLDEKVKKLAMYEVPCNDESEAKLERYGYATRHLSRFTDRHTVRDKRRFSAVQQRR
jgi:hypothetical protein